MVAMCNAIKVLRWGSVYYIILKRNGTLTSCTTDITSLRERDMIALNVTLCLRLFVIKRIPWTKIKKRREREGGGRGRRRDRERENFWHIWSKWVPSKRVNKYKNFFFVNNLFVRLIISLPFYPNPKPLKINIFQIWEITWVKIGLLDTK